MPSDYSVSNPVLHSTYVNWAIHHLTTIQESLAKLNGYSNLNLTGITQSIQSEKQKLIRENTAYRDAAAKLFAGEELKPYHESQKEKTIADSAESDDAADGYNENVCVDCGYFSCECDDTAEAFEPQKEDPEEVKTSEPKVSDFKIGDKVT